MAISDVLCEALEQIESYQKECSFMYDEYKQEIAILKETMWQLQKKLDFPNKEIEDDWETRKQKLGW